MENNWFKTLISVAVNEMNHALKDSGVLLFFVVVPLLYPLLYAYLYNGETIHEVPVVAVDECHSAESRQFLRKADGTPDLKIISYCADIGEARELIRRHKAYGLIHIPSDFSKELAEGRQATVNTYSDMSGLLYYKALLSGCTQVSLSMNRGIKMTRLSGMSDREKEVMTKPIEYDYVAMFNPQNGFCTFLIPAVLILLIQQTMVLGVSLLAGTERERRMKGLEIIGDYNTSPLAILAGRGMCYFIIYSGICLYTLCIVPKMFNLIQLWQPQDIILFCIPYILSCVFFAISISYFVKERESCFLLFVFASVPLLFMSGISWPASNIPAFWKWFSYIFPSTFGINGFVRMTNTGASLYQIRHEYICLWIQTGFYFMMSVMIYIRLFRSDYMPDVKYIRQAALQRINRRKEKIGERVNRIRTKFDR